MGVIDLTNPGEVKMPLVGIVSRFPPSVSGSASSVRELSERLVHQHGYHVEVIRLVDQGESAASGRPVVMDLNARWHMSAELAARRVNRCDVAVIRIDRHVPIGLIDELVSLLEVPLILVLDDVAPGGTKDSRSLANLAGRSGATVVPSQTARRRLQAEAPAGARIEVIPNGSPWTPFQPRSSSRSHIMTWGFMSPGLGAERVVRVLPMLADLDPPPRYRLLGVADPGWAQREAASYRSSLTRLAKHLGVAEQLDIVPVLHPESGLECEIERCDLVAVVYDTRDRSSSRILSEAVSTGRPVVASRFPGAVELLSSGAGRTVAHDDDRAMGEAIRAYLTDDREYLEAARVAADLSPTLSWDTTTRQYAALLARQVGRIELIST